MKEQTCNHEKVYADYVLTSNPPQYPWICKLCGTEGVDIGENNASEYYDIKTLFQNIDK